ncbi:MAG: hypothetical protein AAGL17_03935 [Cyanobacteria bacterium J06576_12]
MFGASGSVFTVLGAVGVLLAASAPSADEASAIASAIAGATASATESNGVAGAEAVSTGEDSSSELVDLAADADRERARQRLLDYLQRLREAPEVPESSTTSFPSFGSAVFDAQLAGYLAYVDAVGTPDILIVGSSRALQGIDPAELQAQLSAQGYPGLKVYNFSVNGATAQVVNFVVSDLLPGELPPVVVWGDGSRAFNDGRRDRTWESISGSAGYQSVVRGEGSAMTESIHGMIAATATSSIVFSDDGSVASYEIGPSLPRGPNTFDVTALDSTFEPLDPSAVAVEDGSVADMFFGNVPEAAESSAVSLTGTRLNGLTLDGLGFSAVGDRFDPAIYYQEFPQVSGQYDGAYSPFALQGAQTTALRQAANAVRRQNSQLIFVNLPLSDSYLDEFRLYYEGRFQQFLRAEGSRYGFEVVDLLQAWSGQSDLFADPSHINQYGAAAIAAQLAQNPTLLLALVQRQ